MWINRKMWIGGVILLFVVSISIAAEPGKKIGVLTFSEQVRYMEAIRGLKDTFNEAGFGEPRMQYIVENAGANKMVAAELVKRLAAEKLDLIFTVGTHATLATSQKIKDIPIVFAQVYDPVAAGIAKGWQSSGNNTTGVSTKIPLSQLIISLKRLKPFYSLAVLYTPGENNSESQLRDLQEIQGNFGIKVVPVPLTKVEDIEQLLPVLISRMDALYITGSNLVNEQLSKIIDMANKGKIITVTHLEDLVEKGVLLGVGPNPYQVGRLAGKKAIKIIEGALPSSLPIDTLEQLDIIVNLKTARAGGFEIPSDFMKTVSRKIE
jgi:putative tryptophan/tyrosine transport system substrate-binding protein